MNPSELEQMGKALIAWGNLLTSWGNSLILMSQSVRFFFPWSQK